MRVFSINAMNKRVFMQQQTTLLLTLFECILVILLYRLGDVILLKGKSLAGLLRLE